MFIGTIVVGMTTGTIGLVGTKRPRDGLAIPRMTIQTVQAPAVVSRVIGR